MDRSGFLFSNKSRAPLPFEGDLEDLVTSVTAPSQINATAKRHVSDGSRSAAGNVEDQRDFVGPAVADLSSRAPNALTVSSQSSTADLATSYVHKKPRESERLRSEPGNVPVQGAFAGYADANLLSPTPNAPTASEQYFSAGSPTSYVCRHCTKVFSRTDSLRYVFRKSEPNSMLTMDYLGGMRRRTISRR
jgi:hypothetical protein